MKYYLAVDIGASSGRHILGHIEDGQIKLEEIYRFENGKGKSCYAVWCPTMDSVEVDNYKLNINGSTSYMIEFANETTEGIKTNLSVESNTVTVDVSERPVLVFCE